VPADEEALLTLRVVRDATVRRLGKLQEQQARFGALTPPNITLDIEDARREIAKIDQQLLVLEQPPPSDEVKQAIRDTHGTMLDFIVAQVMHFGQRQTALEVEVSEVRKSQAEDKEDRPIRQRVLDSRFDRIERTLNRQDDTLAEQTEDLKVVRQRQREIRKWLIRIILVVGALVFFRLLDIWHVIEGWLIR
jgi:hypothetical protein